MSVIMFDSLSWLRVFRNKLKKNYKKMFDMDNPEFNNLWQMYVDNYFKAKEIGLDIPMEDDYPLNINYYISDTDYNNYTDYHKDKFVEFCKLMEEAIEIIDAYLADVSDMPKD